MRNLRILLLTAAAGWLASSAVAADIKLIGNASIGASSVSTEDLKGVFLGTKTSLSDGSRVEPVLAKGGAAHEAFLKEYLGKTDAALQTYFRSLVFTGKGSMLKAFGSDTEIAAYVASHKGAVGYVSAGASVSAVKILDVK